MRRFQSSRFTASVLMAVLALLPVVVGAGLSPSNATVRATAAAQAGSGDPAAWSYLMPGYESRWNPCARIGYRVNLTNAPHGTVAQVKAALRRVNSKSGLRFVYRGTSRILPGAPGTRAYPADTDIVLAWTRPGKSSYLTSGPAGFAGASANAAIDFEGASAWALSDGFVVLNQDIYKQLAAGFGQGNVSGYQGTRGQLLMHELGHVVGLGHTDSDTIQSMYPSMSRKFAVWGAGDISGLTHVGATQGCLKAAPAAKMQGEPITAGLS